MRIAAILTCLATVSWNLATKEPTWVVMIYMSARNDLATYAEANLQQMQRVTSSNNLSILVRLNTIENDCNVTHTLLLKNNSATYIPAPTKYIDGADPHNVIEFCTYVIHNFTATHYALIFWDHGTGPLKPNHSATFHSYPMSDQHHKGVCFDDTSLECLSEGDITHILTTLKKGILHTRKLDIIGFDACSMATLEVAYNVADFADYMVAAQTLEPATGWDYEKVFLCFKNRTPSAKEFAQHIVKAYAQAYQDNQTTLSAIDLRFIPALVNATSNVAQALTKGPVLDLLLLKNNPGIFKKTLSASVFTDIFSFTQNMLRKTENLLQKQNKYQTQKLMILRTHLLLALRNARACIVAHSAPTNSNYHGLSIYLPAYAVDASYKETKFHKNTDWMKFINAYLEDKKQ